MNEKVKKIIKELLPYVIIILVVVLIRTFIITPVTVDGVSMNETLADKDIMILNKLGKNNINRYDVVVIKRNKDKLIKRVLGLPGEKIKCVSGIIYINNEEIENKHAYGKTADFKEYVLSDDEYFVLGDNRENSLDSRSFGPVKKENILGTTSLIIFPFNHIKTLQN